MSKKEKTPGIYSIRNKTNGRIYIGSTKDITTRFKQYMTAVHDVENHPDRASRYPEVVCDIAQLGWDNFEFKVEDHSVEMYDNDTRAIREVEYITKHRSILPEFGYNSTMGGETGSTKHKKYNTGKPKAMILIDTKKNYKAWLYLNGSSTVHKDLGLTKMTIPDAARRGNFMKKRYFLFYADTEQRHDLAEFVRLKRDLLKSNGKNDVAAKEQYKMYLKALEAADECAEYFGF